MNPVDLEERVNELVELLGSHGFDASPSNAATVIELEDEMASRRESLYDLYKDEVLGREAALRAIDRCVEVFIKKVAALIGDDACEAVFDYRPGEAVVLASAELGPSGETEPPEPTSLRPATVTTNPVSTSSKEPILTYEAAGILYPLWIDKAAAAAQEAYLGNMPHRHTDFQTWITREAGTGYIRPHVHAIRPARSATPPHRWAERWRDAIASELQQERGRRLAHLVVGIHFAGPTHEPSDHRTLINTGFTAACDERGINLDKIRAIGHEHPELIQFILLARKTSLEHLLESLFHQTWDSYYP